MIRRVVCIVIVLLLLGYRNMLWIWKLYGWLISRPVQYFPPMYKSLPKLDCEILPVFPIVIIYPKNIGGEFDYAEPRGNKYVLMNHLLQFYEYVIYVDFSLNLEEPSRFQRIIQQAGDVEMITETPRLGVPPTEHILILRKSKWSVIKLQQLYYGKPEDALDQLYTDYGVSMRGDSTRGDLPDLRSGICVYGPEVFNFLRNKSCQKYPWGNISGFSEIESVKLPLVLSSITMGNRIPKYIFQTMETTLLPDVMVKSINKWKQLNPHYSHFYFDSLQCRRFIKDNYPCDVYEAYDKLLPGAYKADFWRYCVLYKYGGVYADSRTTPLVPLDSVLEKYDRFVVPYDYIHSFLWQGFFCSTARHPILRKIIETMCLMIHKGDYGDNSLDITGPSLMGRIVNSYMGNGAHCNFSQGKDVVYGIKILSHGYWDKGYIKYGNIPIIQTYCTRDNKLFLKMGGKEKYFESWFKRRIYKKELGRLGPVRTG